MFPYLCFFKMVFMKMKKTYITLIFFILLFSTFVSATDFTTNNEFWLDIQGGAIEESSSQVTFSNSGVTVSSNNMVFDGDDILTSSSNLFNTDNVGTMCAWITPSDIENYYSVMDYAVQYSESRDFIKMSIYEAGGNSVLAQFFSTSPSANDAIDGQNDYLSDDSNYLMCISSDGSDYDVYLDGVQQTDNYVIGSNSGKWFNDGSGTNYYFHVGGNRGASIDPGFSYFKGNMQSSMYWSSELSSASITELYNEGNDFNPYYISNQNITFLFNEDGIDEYERYNLTTTSSTFQTPARVYNQFGYGQEFLQNLGAHHSIYDGVTYLDPEKDFTISFDHYVDSTAYIRPIMFLADNYNNPALNNIVFFQYQDSIMMCAVTGTQSNDGIHLEGIQSDSDTYCFENDDIIADDLTTGWHNIVVSFNGFTAENGDWESALDGNLEDSGTIYLDSYAENAFNDLCVGWLCFSTTAEHPDSNVSLINYQSPIASYISKIDNLNIYGSYLELGVAGSAEKYIYNYSKTYTPPEYTELINPTSVTSVSYTDISHENVTLHATSTFTKTLVDDIYGSFQYKQNADATWLGTERTNINTESGNDYTSFVDNLNSSTLYDYRVLINKTITYDSLLWTQWSAYTTNTFTTASPPTEISISAIENITIDSAIVSCDVLYGDNISNIIVDVKYNNTYESFNYSDYEVISSIGIYTFNLENLSVFTTYSYRCRMTFVNDTVESELLSNSADFTTLYYDLPSIATLSANVTSITTATLNGAINFTGYPYIQTYFNLNNVSTTWFLLGDSYENVTESSTVYFNAIDLIPNTYYNVSFCARYDTVTNATTPPSLSNAEHCGDVVQFYMYTPPVVYATGYTGFLDNITVKSELNIEAEDTVTIKYLLLDYSTTTYTGTYEDSSEWVSINANGNYAYNFDGLEDNTYYKYIVLLNYSDDSNGDAWTIINSDIVTIKTLDSIEDSHEFNVLGFEMHVEDAYFFSYVLVLATIIGMFLLVFLIRGNEGASKILMWVITGFVLIEIIVLNMNSFIPLSQLILTLFGVFLFIFIFIIQEVKGGVYG